MDEPLQTQSSYLAQYSGDKLVAVLIIFGILDVLAVSLRFVARHVGHVRLGIGDYLMIPALILDLGFISVCAVMIKYGAVGYHKEYFVETDPEKLVFFSKSLIAVIICYLWAVVFPKLALLTLYHQVFPQLWLRRLCYLLASVLILTATACMITAFTFCRPLARAWSDVPGTCINEYEYLIWISFPNILTDIILLGIPLPIIWKLNNTKTVKIGLIVTFLTGSLGLVTSILRFSSFLKTTEDVLSDGTWSSVDLLEWSMVEIGTYTIAACLVTLRPLLACISRKRFTSKIDSEQTYAPVRASKGSRLQMLNLNVDPSSAENGSVNHDATQNHSWQRLDGSRDSSDQGASGTGSSSKPRFWGNSTHVRAEAHDIPQSFERHHINVQHDISVTEASRNG